MFRRLSLITIVVSVLALLVVGSFGLLPAQADSANAWTVLQTNLRETGSVHGALLGTLPVNTPVVIEGRNSDATWLLVHATTLSARGWGLAGLFKIAAGVRLYGFPISTEDVAAGSTPPHPSSTDLENLPAYLLPVATLPPDIPSGAINLPVLPPMTPGVRNAMRAVYRYGQSLGNNPRVFSKVGDCHTDHPSFFNEIGLGAYNLGQYGNLQGIIGYYSVPPRPGLSNSFNTQSQAAHSAFTSGAVLDWKTSNPNFCQAEESPLRCEYRIDKPSVALIMFGVVDVEVMSAAQFNTYMRYIVKDTLDRGIIPVLSTTAENKAYPDKARLFNQIVVGLAHQKNLPLINLQAALAKLPSQGLDTDGIHLTRGALDKSAFFDAQDLQFGYTMRNLITLQALDIIQKSIES
ncbi:MAG TPA: SGNH/GDSL hydrolase family protein [Aggregatilineales bacterium]|nr:SGNH/GDSL hydrolase family protein [Aggregatilineales bacterium]